MNEGVLDTSDFVRVHNDTGEDIVGGFDGTEYLFRNGGFTDVPMVAAQHIFDVGSADKSRCLLRMGWLANTTMKDALAKLAKVTFTDIPPVPTNVTDLKRGRAKASKPTPLVNAGVEAGEAVPNTVSPSEADEAVGDL